MSRIKIYLFLAIGMLIVLAWAALRIYEKNPTYDSMAPEPKISTNRDSVPRAASETQVSEKEVRPVLAELPKKIMIDVPFTSQAPFANWDQFHEEACEEASLIMLVRYLRQENLDQESADREILDLIKFQVRKYGDYQDSSAEDLVRLAKDYYGMDNLKVIYDFEPQDLKKELAKGKPVILPAAGRMLENPNFKQPGPLYHVLILIGYDRDTMITNDPGTRKGRHYEYPLDTLYGAIHDFPGDKEKILQGRKAMIVVAD